MNTHDITNRLKSMGVALNFDNNEAVVAEGGSCNDRMLFVLRGGDVFVSGDRGCAVYSLTQPARFETIAEYDIAYFVSKCRTMEGTQRGYAWKEQRAYEWMLNNYGKGAALHALQMGACSCPEALSHWFNTRGNNFAAIPPFEGVSDVGLAIHHQAYWHHEGIKRVAQHLAQKAAGVGA